jgi:hypothetical protein
VFEWAMAVELQRDAAGDRLVVHCDDPVLARALADLAFRGDADGYAKRFPPGSVTDAILARFEASLTPMLRQTAGLDTVPWREALHDAARRFDAAGVDWWLAGSVALGVRGVRLAPRDVDLIVAEADVKRAAEAFADVLIEPAVETGGWIARWFGRTWLGARVEWVAGVEETVDQPVPTDFGPAAAACLASIEWEGERIRVPPIELQRGVAVRRELAGRVALIDDAFPADGHASPGSNPPG